jgi:hypothetical protein
MAVASPAAAQPGGTFVDDDGNHHEGMIEAVFGAEITLGCDPGASNLYCPASWSVVARWHRSWFAP